MLNICRTCNVKVYSDARVGQTIVINDTGDGRCLSPSKLLKKDRTDAKKSKNWNQQYYDNTWQTSYLKQLKNNPEARALLNSIYKMLSTEDVCLVFAEAEGWDTSARKTITGILMGAGIKPSNIAVGHDFTEDEVAELSAAYLKYKTV